jgi:hypothetical protein
LAKSQNVLSYTRLTPSAVSTNAAEQLRPGAETAEVGASVLTRSVNIGLRYLHGKNPIRREMQLLPHSLEPCASGLPYLPAFLCPYLEGV